MRLGVEPAQQRQLYHRHVGLGNHDGHRGEHAMVVAARHRCRPATLPRARVRGYAPPAQENRRRHSGPGRFLQESRSSRRSCRALRPLHGEGRRLPMGRHHQDRLRLASHRRGMSAARPPARIRGLQRLWHPWQGPPPCEMKYVGMRAEVLGVMSGPGLHRGVARHGIRLSPPVSVLYARQCQSGQPQRGEPARIPQGGGPRPRRATLPWP